MNLALMSEELPDLQETQTKAISGMKTEPSYRDTELVFSSYFETIFLNFCNNFIIWGFLTNFLVPGTLIFVPFLGSFERNNLSLQAFVTVCEPTFSGIGILHIVIFLQKFLQFLERKTRNPRFHWGAENLFTANRKKFSLGISTNLESRYEARFSGNEANSVRRDPRSTKALKYQQIHRLIKKSLESPQHATARGSAGYMMPLSE